MESQEEVYKRALCVQPGQAGGAAARWAARSLLSRAQFNNTKHNMDAQLLFFMYRPSLLGVDRLRAACGDEGMRGRGGGGAQMPALTLTGLCRPSQGSAPRARAPMPAAMSRPGPEPATGTKSPRAPRNSTGNPGVSVLRGRAPATSGLPQ